MASLDEFCALFSRCERSADHLELRSEYLEDMPTSRLWQEGLPVDRSDRATWWTPWLELISSTVASGVQIRRARIVSEPVSDYIRSEHATTWRNIAAGEQVRWLPRRNTARLLVPANDFWVFDGLTVVTGHHDGRGNLVEIEIKEDPVEARMYSQAFDEVWKRALHHDEYTPV
ncbi:DUF6879 family protein [Micromonospora sp. NPDC050417]|uniref:DUF6879 family protein n=1 Tax=Micromonospora sp. NPDC050417 TaxID=3364280 RepID=UPI003791ED8E